MSRTWTCVPVVLWAVASVAGCGGTGYPTARLEGTVSVDSRPVEQGTIGFTPLEAGRGAGVMADIVAGRYVARHVPHGKVRVDFHATRETGRTVDFFGEPHPETVNIIPMKYQAGIEMEVDAGAVQRDFHLTSD